MCVSSSTELVGKTRSRSVMAEAVGKTTVNRSVKLKV